MKRIFISALSAMVLFTVFAQVPGKSIPDGAGFLTVTIDSIDTDRSYLMVTVMRDNFTPFDYEMVPSRRGSMTVEMRTPPGEMPFSVMAYEDTNLNRRLDLNDDMVPVEKSAVVHCRGGETHISLTLVHYDLLLDAWPQDTIPQDTTSHNQPQILRNKKM